METIAMTSVARSIAAKRMASSPFPHCVGSLSQPAPQCPPCFYSPRATTWITVRAGVAGGAVVAQEFVRVAKAGGRLGNGVRAPQPDAGLGRAGIARRREVAQIVVGVAVARVG